MIGRCLRFATLLIVLAATACTTGKTASTPLTPTLPDLVGANVAGTWTQVGGTRTWTLIQVGFNVGGTSVFSEDNNAYLGAVSGNGTVEGGVGLGVFDFDDYCDRPTTPKCSIEITGQLTVTGNSMTGPYIENDNCNGARIGQTKGTITMKRQ